MSEMKIQIEANLNHVRKAIEKSATKAVRDAASVNLVAVSKKQPLDRIKAMLDCGHILYGENRVQEALERWGVLKPDYPNIKLHLIGPLQTNKVKEAVSLFDVIETVDRSKLVKVLAQEMKKQDKHLPCFIQVNTGEEQQKAGVLPKDLGALVEECKKEDLHIVGLMCIPPQDEPAALHFAFLQKLAAEYNLPELSMGMSSDFEKAVPLGATYVRVGTALFGDRDF